MKDCSYEGWGASRALKLGFIGGGINSAIGYTHFNASRMDGHFVLEAGCFSRDQKVNADSAAAYGIDEQRLYSDWRLMLERESGNLDAVAILTPIPDHLESVCAALKQGLPVICEKPLGLSSEECERIEQVVAEEAGYLAMTLNYSGYPMVRQLREMVKEGRLGTLQQIVIEMPQESFLRKGANPQDWRRRDYSVPTVSLDLGVHVHHLVDFITSGMKPKRVSADHSSFGFFEGLVDNVFCIAEYEEKLKVQSWWGKTALGHRNGLRLRVYGSEASAEWYQINPEFLQWADNDGHYYTLDRSSGEATLAQQPRYNRFKAGHPSGFVEAFANLYCDIAQEIFSRASGSSTQTSTGFVAHACEGGAALRFLECISKSAASLAWVSCE
jgi:predicted dehydrogenase